jgi:hypothetical protein
VKDRRKGPLIINMLLVYGLQPSEPITLRTNHSPSICFGGAVSIGIAIKDSGNRVCHRDCRTSISGVRSQINCWLRDHSILHYMLIVPMSILLRGELVVVANRETCES